MTGLEKLTAEVVGDIEDHRVPGSGWSAGCIEGMHYMLDVWAEVSPSDAEAKKREQVRTLLMERVGAGR